ncbi:MAG: aminodeoxychorismate synthase component I [Alphaproteobacteria bacterium]|nr:aminodeoxychorismate synthase component I [Alphaproteobacteria bacterium]
MRRSGSRGRDAAIIEIPYRDPAVAFAPLAETPFAVYLDSAAADQRGRHSIIAASPREVVKVESLTAGVFETLRALLGARHRPWAGPGAFGGGIVGFLGYEVGGLLEALPEPRPADFPVHAAFGVYETFATFDLATRRAWAIDINGRHAHAAAFEAQLGRAGGVRVDSTIEPRWRSDFSADAYTQRVQRVIDYIGAGDVFQACLTQRWTAPWPPGLPAYAVYQRLRRLAPAPYAAFMALENGTAVLSASPERFLSATADGHVETRPIKGTRPRGRTAPEDRQLADALAASVKDRAENLMIVDLLRNDLSRVCRIGSVAVPELCRLETFAGAHHLVSSVTGRLRTDRDAIDLLMACFPGGSVTGAPKIRAMQIISELEASARGPYCGAMMWLGYDGALDSSILIRTLLKAGDTAYAHAGGGIVSDSNPEDELRECLVKAGPLLAALGADPP